MLNHTDLLNFLAVKFDLQTYLEIGVNVKKNNFDHIICREKYGVDPKPSAEATYQMSSDVFFSMLKATKLYGLIFIDGLHHADQVKKDFENSLLALGNNGFIVLHDCAPEFEVNTHIPRDKRGVWNGDVYKFICTLGEYDGINFVTVDFDHGCTVVWRDLTVGEKRPAGEIDWLYFQNNKHLFRLVSPQKFIEMMNQKSKTNS